MGRIKRFFLKILLAVIVIGMIAGLACILINSRVVRTTEDQIAYTVRGDVEIKSFAVDNLKNFDADCIMVLGCGIEDEETPSPMLKDRLDVGIELYKQGAAPQKTAVKCNSRQYQGISVPSNKKAGLFL